jgi:hypothetical protein
LVTAKRPSAAKKGNPKAGIPADRWVVERRGAYWWVVDVRTRGITAGPFNARDRAQQQADRWNVTFREARRG